jgi:hypothetical protein
MAKHDQEIQKKGRQALKSCSTLPEILGNGGRRRAGGNLHMMRLELISFLYTSSILKFESKKLYPSTG